MSTATKIVIGTVSVSAVLTAAIIFSFVLA